MSSLLHVLFGSCFLAAKNPYVSLGTMRFLAGVSATGKGYLTCPFPQQLAMWPVCSLFKTILFCLLAL